MTQADTKTFDSYIIKGVGGFYYVKTADGVVECKPRGIFRKRKITPVAGDFVRLEQEGGSFVIAEILPRKNLFIRPPVANLDYLFIVALGYVFTFTSQIYTGLFTAMGASTTVLRSTSVGLVANAILDPLFIFGVGPFPQMGVAGAAWATLIAQGISAVISFSILMKTLSEFDEKNEKLWSADLMKTISLIALPSILQQSTVSIGMMLVQSVVNSFGSEVLAGFSAAMRIESIVVVPMSAMGNAMSSYTAQNIGADKTERVIKGYHASYLIIAVLALLIMLPLETADEWLIKLFIGNEGTADAMATGTGYLSFMGWFFAFIGFKMITDGLLRGAGDMTMFTIANLVNLSIRVIVAFVFAPVYGIAMVWVAVPIGWAANWLISGIEYRSGRWKTKRT